MFAGQLGIRLMVLAGSNIPRPVSHALISALTQVQVDSNDETGDGFQISLTLGKDKLLDCALLKSGELDIFNRVIIAVVMGLTPEVLIDGVITNHQVSPSNDPGMSTLTVTGKDISLMLDVEENNGAYPNQTDSVIVGQILAKYAKYGLIPVLTQTTNVRMVTDGTARQYETDLGCIQRLAGKNGFVFYIEPLTIGTSLAYWGPKTRSGVLQPALSIGMGTATNVKNLNFGEEGLSAESIKASYIEPFSKTVIPLPAVPPLRIPPLVSSPTPSKKVRLLRDTANKGAAATLEEMMSAMTNQPDSVRGDGELDTTRYGSVLRARRLVGVRGAGASYNGIYCVKSVSHRISRGGYTQSFSISREGTGSLTPAVVP